jgi:hypothetical protein
MNIDELQAGPELDALIAEKIFGWQWNIRDGICYAEHDCFNAPDLWPRFQPSTSIAVAWEIVEEFNRMWSLHYLPDAKVWSVCFIDKSPLNAVEAPTAQLAICRFALKTMT